METLQATTRDMNTKAKKLRREGFVTGSICGRELEHSVLIQFKQNEAQKQLAHTAIGGRITVDVDGTSYSTIIKDISRDPLSQKFIDISFQQLVAGEKIKNTAEIIFRNEEHAQGYVTSNLSEITYRALPKDLVEKIELDVSAYPIGTNIKVADLDIAKNPAIEVLTPLEESVLHVSEHAHGGMEEEETEDADAATDAASSES